MTFTLLGKKERGEINIRISERRRFAEVFGLTLDEFDATWRAQQVHDRPAPTMIPVVNKGPAGTLLPYDHDQYAGGEYHNPMEFIDRSKDTQDPLAFALVIIGDSMQPNLHEGDTVVFAPYHRVPNPTVELKPGCIVFVRVQDDGVTVGRYQPLTEDGKDRFLITKDNASHRPIVVHMERVEQLAVAVEFRSTRGLGR